MRHRSLLLPLFGLWLLLGRLSPAWARIILIKGDTTVRRTGDTYTVRTGPNDRAALLFEDGSLLKLNGSTTLELPVTPATSRRSVPAVRVASASLRLASWEAARPAEVPATPLEGPIPSRLVLRQGEVWISVVRGRGVTTEARAGGAPGAAARAAPDGATLDLRLAEDGTTTLTVGAGEVEFANARDRVTVRPSEQSVARPGQPPTRPVAVNLPVILEWTNDVQPVALLLETSYVSQDPERLKAVLREAEALPAGVERSRRLGDVQHDMGELQQALAAYEAALAALGPAAPAGERAALEARIGQTRRELGELPQAEAAFRRSLALDPGLTAARAGLVMTLLGQRQNAAALTEARAAVTRDNRSPLAHTVLALAQIRGGDRDAARQSLERAVALDPQYAPAYAWQSFLLRAEERLDDALAAARRAVELAPFSSLAWQSLADAAFALGRTREARQAAERAVALNPNSPGARVSLGRVLLQEGKLDAAARAARQAVTLDPDLDRAQFFHGVVLWEQRQLAPAAAALRRAVALDPDYLEARAYLARVYVDQGRRSEAVQVAREARVRDPNFAPVRAALGRVNWRAGRLKEAAAEYRAALALAPDSALYHLEAAQVDLDLNDMPAALTNGLAAVSLAPGASEAHAVLGLIYDRMENREQALREYREALSLSPENALARVGLGVSFPGAGERGTEVRRFLSGAAPDGRGRTLQAIASEREPVDGLREVAQGILRDPAVLARLFKPGVTAEVAPVGGSHETFGLDFTHRDQFALGQVHDLTFGSARWLENYRNHQPERRALGWLNLAGTPAAGTQVLAQYFYTGQRTAPPGSLSDPLRSARSASWNDAWDLSGRYQVGPDTFAWLHGGGQISHLNDQNPAAPTAAYPTLFSRVRLSQLSVDGRLDHRWGRHTATYVLFAGREQFDSRDNSLSEVTGTTAEIDFFGRERIVTHTLQDDYRPGSRLSLVAGVTAERFTGREQTQRANQPPATERDAGETSWLPYGQATYLLTPRDLVRVIANERRERLSSSLLQPSEAFLVAEPPSVALGGRTTNYELDYERRLSVDRFAKLFVFRSDVDDFFVTPAVRQTPDLLGFIVTEARSEGIGLRYEQRVGRFLSGFLRYTYRDVTDRTPGPRQGRQLPMNPRSRATLGLNYWDRAGNKLYLEANWNSRMFVDDDYLEAAPSQPRPEFHGRLLVNLRLGQERTVRREWVLRINNLFNTSTIYWPGFPAPGRTYEVQYRFRF